MENHEKIIEKLQEQLDEMKKVQDKLILITSHDLKTPITSIIGFAKLIKQRPEMNKEGKEKCLDAIIEESERVFAMVENILTWQQIKGGKIKFTEEPVSISFILSTLLKTFESKITKYNLTLKAEIEKDLVIKGEKRSLEEIINNLMDNAIKYTEDRGHIELHAKKSPEKKIQISISDTGCGIKEDTKEEIFNCPKPLRGVRGKKGLGLGLFITKNLVEMHRGKICFEPKIKGTTFYIEFDAS